MHVKYLKFRTLKIQMAKEHVEYSIVALSMHWYKIYDYAVFVYVT